MSRRIVAFMLAGAIMAIGAPLSAANLKSGDRAPDFKAQGVDGKEYSLPQDAAATVICFTCNQCPIAQAYEDRFIEFAEEYEEKGIKFIALNVNFRESFAAMKERARAKGYPFPYVFDASGKSCFAYGAKKTPHLFLVDGEGKIAYQGAFDDSFSSPQRHYLAEAVDAVLAGEKPEVDKTPVIGCAIQPKR